MKNEKRKNLVRRGWKEWEEETKLGKGEDTGNDKREYRAGKVLFWENETREARRRQNPTQEWKIEVKKEVKSHGVSFFFSAIQLFIFLERGKGRRSTGNHSRLSLCGDRRMRRHNHLPLIASLTPESCRFLTDIPHIRWRRRNGGHFAADGSNGLIK